MAGKLCQGGIRNNIGAARLSGSKSYCEGMAYRSAGTAIAKPKVDNPHMQGSEDSIAWNNGWDLADANTGGTIDRSEAGCCAPTGIISA